MKTTTYKSDIWIKYITNEFFILFFSTLPRKRNMNYAQMERHAQSLQTSVSFSLALTLLCMFGFRSITAWSYEIGLNKMQTVVTTIYGLNIAFRLHVLRKRKKIPHVKKWNKINRRKKALSKNSIIEKSVTTNLIKVNPSSCLQTLIRFFRNFSIFSSRKSCIVPKFWKKKSLTKRAMLGYSRF